MILDSFFEEMDGRLFHWVTGLPPRGERDNAENDTDWEALIEEEIEGHLIAREHMDPHERVFHTFGVIDQKASAMLTHISVMIAANALLLSITTGDFLNGFSVVLLSSFILIALLSLRLLRFWSSLFPGRGARQRPQDEIQRQIDASFRDEIFYRGRLYRLALSATTLLTAVSALFIFLYDLELAFNVGWVTHVIVMATILAIFFSLMYGAAKSNIMNHPSQRLLSGSRAATFDFVAKVRIGPSASGSRRQGGAARFVRFSRFSVHLENPVRALVAQRQNQRVMRCRCTAAP